MKQIIAAATTAFAALSLTLSGWTAASASSAASCSNTVAGPFTSSGSTIYANGSPYVPHGFTVSGLEHADYQDYAADDAAQISAAHTAWCASMIRLQVSQQQIVSGSAAYRTALYAEVRQAVNLDMAVVINDQTQHDTASQDVVTPATSTFWAYIASRYKTYKRVMFDMLNEPTNVSVTQWQDAFRPLAQQIRAAAPNLIWAEGYDGAQTLAGIGPDHFLGVSDTAYVIHHPAGAHDATAWNADYGYLQAEGRPVIDGEWTNWSANRGECWSDAPAAVPAYLAWMKQNHIGYAIWALGWDGSSADYPSGYTGPAVLADGSYGNPVGFSSDWACTTGLHEGAGQDIMADFRS